MKLFENIIFLITEDQQPQKINILYKCKEKAHTHAHIHVYSMFLMPINLGKSSWNEIYF